MQQIITMLTPHEPETLLVQLDKNGQEAQVLVAFIGKKKEAFRLKTIAQHQAQHTQSHTIVRGVLFDEAIAVVEGLIKIDVGSQDTNAFLEEKILLIGNRARAHAEPQLEIEANDVKASHAATVGRLEEDHLFYLMSRGLSKKQAQRAMVLGFFQPILDVISDTKQKQVFRTKIMRKLESFL